VLNVAWADYSKALFAVHAIFGGVAQVAEQGSHKLPTTGDPPGETKTHRGVFRWHVGYRGVIWGGCCRRAQLRAQRCTCRDPESRSSGLLWSREAADLLAIVDEDRNQSLDFSGALGVSHSIGLGAC
jgi:hypothetical protein